MHHADVGFEAKHALGHIAAVDTEVAQDGAQLARIGFRFFRAADIRFGNDLKKRERRRDCNPPGCRP